MLTMEKLEARRLAASLELSLESSGLDDALGVSVILTVSQDEVDLDITLEHLGLSTSNVTSIESVASIPRDISEYQGSISVNSDNGVLNAIVRQTHPTVENRVLVVDNLVNATAQVFEGATFNQEIEQTIRDLTIGDALNVIAAVHQNQHVEALDFNGDSSTDLQDALIAVRSSHASNQHP